jgi:hypothetical protein
MVRNSFFKLNLPEYTTTPDIIITNSYGYLKINNQKIKFPKGFYIFIKLIPATNVISKVNNIETRDLVWVKIDNDFYIEANGECEILWQKVD